jgi:hypothetical protein
MPQFVSYIPSSETDAIKDYLTKHKLGNNKYRVKVGEGQSNTLGIVSKRSLAPDLSRISWAHPYLFFLLMQFAEKHVSPHISYTSIQVNHNYPCNPHKDIGNVGDSYILAFGEFTGGELCIEDINYEIDYTINKLKLHIEKLLAYLKEKEMIERYRDQYHVEHGFAWLKSQADINPMFIQSPRRIAAMGLVYCLGLIIWNLIQRTVRKHLTATGTGLPYHRNKPSANITTRFLFELFPQVQTIVLIDDSGHQEKRTLGLEEWQLKAAEALGTSLGAFKPVIDW